MRYRLHLGLACFLTRCLPYRGYATLHFVKPRRNHVIPEQENKFVFMGVFA